MYYKEGARFVRSLLVRESGSRPNKGQALFVATIATYNNPAETAGYIPDYAALDYVLPLEPMVVGNTVHIHNVCTVSC